MAPAGPRSRTVGRAAGGERRQRRRRRPSRSPSATWRAAGRRWASPAASWHCSGCAGWCVMLARARSKRLGEREAAADACPMPGCRAQQGGVIGGTGDGSPCPPPAAARRAQHAMARRGRRCRRQPPLAMDSIGCRVGMCMSGSTVRGAGWKLLRRGALAAQPHRNAPQHLGQARRMGEGRPAFQLQPERARPHKEAAQEYVKAIEAHDWSDRRKVPEGKMKRSCPGGRCHLAAISGQRPLCPWPCCCWWGRTSGRLCALRQHLPAPAGRQPQMPPRQWRPASAS